jgi:hypothetical protein
VADDPIDLDQSEIAPLLQAMIADGVDPSDENAVREWLALEGLTDEELDVDEDYEEISFKEAFGLPDRLPPLRLPPEEELVAAARASRLLGAARTLAEWVGDGRAVIEDGEPSGADCVSAARAVDVEFDEPVERLADLPELAHLWELAEAVELIEIGVDRAVPGPAMDAWPGGEESEDLGDEDALDVWATALAVVMTSLDLDADLYGDNEDVEFHGAGGAAIMALFLARSEGLPFAELSAMIGELMLVTETWVAAHGDPAQVLLGRLNDLGAVTVDDDEVVRLTPLGQWAMWAQLQASDVEIDVLPPVEEMTAADLVLAAEGFTEDELAAESAAWLALRTTDDAAKQLLEVAATGAPADRMYATSVVTQLGSAVEPHWRAALQDPRLRSYAKLALEIEPVAEDVAWLLTDVLAATSEADGPEEIAAQLSDAVPAGQEQEIFDVMWRLPHPSAGEVLSLLGTHHPDKQIAKAARKAAFKAASHDG